MPAPTGPYGSCGRRRLGRCGPWGRPAELAPLIDPNLHSCGTVYPHGINELSHPEQGIYLVGMKSYGRAPTFLAMTGYEQVRSITTALAKAAPPSGLLGPDSRADSWAQVLRSIPVNATAGLARSA